MISIVKLRRSPNGLRAIFLAASVALLAPLPTSGIDNSSGIRIQGPGSEPQIGFACCDQSTAQMQTLFADPGMVPALRDLHAQVAVAIVDFSPQRTEVVQRLNQVGIPTIAWILLRPEDGLYLNADNASAVASRVIDFEKWSASNHLQWAAVGLDVEPNFSELARFKGHRWRLFAYFLRNCFDAQRMSKARQAYAALIGQIQSYGYSVQIYPMPYLPAERSVRSTLLDRMLGTVDIRGNQEFLMLYTNVARPIGAAMIWSIGPDAQGISVGSTWGDGAPGIGSGPLDWEEFSRDLIVASHFTHHIGVYNLEGCVRQGFLPRLQAMNWSQTVIIPSKNVTRARRLGLIIRAILLIASWLPWIIVTLVLLITWLILWRRKRRRTARPFV